MEPATESLDHITNSDNSSTTVGENKNDDYSHDVEVNESIVQVDKVDGVESSFPGSEMLEEESGIEESILRPKHAPKVQSSVPRSFSDLVDDEGIAYGGSMDDSGSQDMTSSIEVRSSDLSSEMTSSGVAHSMSMCNSNTADSIAPSGFTSGDETLHLDEEEENENEKMIPSLTEESNEKDEHSTVPALTSDNTVQNQVTASNESIDNSFNSSEKSNSVILVEKDTEPILDDELVADINPSSAEAKHSDSVMTASFIEESSGKTVINNNNITEEMVDQQFIEKSNEIKIKQDETEKELTVKETKKDSLKCSPSVDLHIEQHENNSLPLDNCSPVVNGSFTDETKKPTEIKEASINIVQTKEVHAEAPPVVVESTHHNGRLENGLSGSIDSLILDKIDGGGKRKRLSSERGDTLPRPQHKLHNEKNKTWGGMNTLQRARMIINDDYKFPDSVTPTKVETFRSVEDYDVPFIDDEAFYCEDWYVNEDNRWSFLDGAGKADFAEFTMISPESINPVSCGVGGEPIEISARHTGNLEALPNAPVRRRRGLLDLCGCVGRRPHPVA